MWGFSCPFIAKTSPQVLQSRILNIESRQANLSPAIYKDLNVKSTLRGAQDSLVLNPGARVALEWEGHSVRQTGQGADSEEGGTLGSMLDTPNLWPC